MTAITGITQAAGASGGCSAADLTIGSGTVTTTTVAGGGSAGNTLVGAISMKTAAGDGCQGATVTVSGTVSGEQTS